MVDPYEPPRTSSVDEGADGVRGPARMHFELAFDFGRAFSSGFEAIKSFPGSLWLGGLLMVLFDLPGGGGGSDDDEELGELFSLGDRVVEGAPGLALTQDAVTPDPIGSLVELIPGFAALTFVFAFFVVMLLLYSFIRTGFIRQAAKAARHQSGLADLFSGLDRMFAMLGSTILQNVILFGILMLLLVPVFIAAAIAGTTAAWIAGGVMFLLGIIPLINVWMGLKLADFCVALDNCGPIEAIARSWQLTKGHRLQLFLFTFLMGLMYFAAAIVGALLLCIGMVVTLPLGRSLVGVGFAESYLLLTRGFVRDTADNLPNDPWARGEPGTL